MATPIPFGAPAWADSYTADLEADRAFYQGLFGWTAEDSGKEFDHFQTFFKDGRPVMGIMPCPPGAETSKAWNVYFRTENCDDSTARARELGGMVAVEPTEVAGQLRFSMVFDPKGALFGLLELKGGSGFEAWGEDNAVCWTEYGVDGVPTEAMGYYADLLGWKVETPPWDEGNPRAYAAVRLPDSEVEFGGCHESTEPPSWYAMVQVADADAVCAKAKELGGQVIGEPEEVPGARIAALAAPSGTIVSITQYVPFGN